MAGVVRRDWKTRIISLLIVVSIATVMLPVGALTAFAHTTTADGTKYDCTGKTKVVRGIASVSQNAGGITLKEDSEVTWSFGQTVTLGCPANVTFAGKPTIKANGTAIAVTAVDSRHMSFEVDGDNDFTDQVDISNIRLYVGNALADVVTMDISDPANTANSIMIDVADIKDGLAVTVDNKDKEVKIGENDQAVSSVTLTETSTDTIDSDDVITITCPDGVTFYEPPTITENTDGFALDSDTASLSADRKSASWTVNDATNNAPVVLTITDPKANLASTIATGKDISFTFACSNADVAVAPSPSKVAEAISGSDINVTADATPDIHKTTNQQAGNITIKENSDGLLETGDFTLTLESTGCGFASTPQATPSGGLTLENAGGDPVTTAVAGSLSKYNNGGAKFNRSTWTINDGSTDINGGEIAIEGIVLNVDSSATAGTVNARILGCGVDKTVTIAYILPSSNGGSGGGGSGGGGTSSEFTGGTTKTVVRGVGSTYGQPVCNITITESTEDSWDVADQEIKVTAPYGVEFAAKPTVKVNGTAVTVTMISPSKMAFDVAGIDDQIDTIVISNIKLYVGNISSLASTLSLYCEYSADTSTAYVVEVADIKDGLIVGVADPWTAVDVGENDQAVSVFTLTESTTNTLEPDDAFSVTCPDGVTFYEPPIITESVNGFALYNNVASLSSDRKTATWTIGNASDNNIVKMTVYATVNIAPTVLTRTDIKFAFTTSNSEFPIAPSLAKVAETVSENDLTVTPASSPVIHKQPSQTVSDIIIKEAVPDLLYEEQFTLTIETAGCSFAIAPVATPTGGFALENMFEYPVTTSVEGTLSKTQMGAPFNRSTWTIAEASTDLNGGTITIEDLVINVDPSAQLGPLVMHVVGCGMDKIVTVANIAATPLANVTASSTPTIKVNVSNQDAGEITITETRAGALAAVSDGIVLKIFGVTADNEIMFSQKPTVSVVSGDIDMNTSGTLTDLNGGSTGPGTDARYAIPIYADSGKASTIKISGIKYDVSSKAIEGSVQVVVMNGTTRIGTVSNAVVEQDSIYIPANITAKTDIQSNSKGWFKTAPKVTLTADNQNALIFYKWDGSSWNTYSGPITAPEGVHTLYYSWDPDNAEAVKSLETKVDTQGPGFTDNSEYPWPSGTVFGEITVGLNASDSNSGVATTYLLVDGEIVGEDSATPYLYNLDTRYSENGTHTIRMEMYDVAGNMSFNSSTVEFNNGPAPVTNAKSNIDPNDIGWFSEKPQVILKTDVEGATTYYSWDYMTEWQEYTDPFLAGNGISYLYVYSDKPGCVVEDIQEYEVRVDDTKPVINSTSLPLQNSSISGSIEISVDATDSVSGIYGVYLLVDGEYVAEDTQTPYSFTLNTKDYSNGRHTIGIEAYDYAYNYEERSTEVTFNASSGGGGGGGGGGGAPTSTLSAPQDLKGTAGNGAINLTWSESKDKNVSEYRIYKVDGTGAADKPSGLKPLATVKTAKYDDVSAKPGTYTYYVTAADSRGTESKAARVVVIYPVVKGQKVFSDIPSTAWYKDFVSTLASNDITGGYPDGTFKPQGQVTRAEFAKMICTAMGWTLEDPASASFSDVTKSHWAFKYVETMKKHGVTSGYPDGTFAPDKKITRAEIAAMIAKALNLPADSSSNINDIKDSWAKQHIGACIKAGIVSGYPDSTFKPGSNASRAEAAKMIVGLLNNKK